MNKNEVRLPLLAACLGGSLLWGAASDARANLLLDVDVNTSSLQGEAGSEVFFVLTDGSGLGDGNNTVALSNFVLGGGSLDVVDPFGTFGGATGDMASGVSLNDSSGLNEFAQYFTPGSDLSFTLDATTNADQGPIPDGLFMFLADGSGSLVPTSDPSGGNSLFAITFDSGQPGVANYDSTQLTLIAPPVGVPEPSTTSLLVGALIAMLGLRRRRVEAAVSGEHELIRLAGTGNGPDP